MLARFLAAVRLGEVGKTLKLEARSFDHLLQVDHKLGVHRIVGSPEGIKRRKAGGVKDTEHAQLLKAAFVDAPVFLLHGTAKHSGPRQVRGPTRTVINGRASPHLEAARSPAGSPIWSRRAC